jgi:pimeloyl-ACP methyl ester carboxylesterase
LTTGVCPASRPVSSKTIQSYVPRAVSSFGYYARTLSQALANLGLEFVHAVGHQTGADVATELAVREQDSVRTFCLIGPPYLPGDELEERLEESYGDPPVPPLDEEGSHLLDHWKRMRREGGHPGDDPQDDRGRVTGPGGEPAGLRGRAWRGPADALRAGGVPTTYHVLQGRRPLRRVPVCT